MVFPYLIILLQTCHEMLTTHDTIISDTSCLILLSNIDELHLLQKLYNTVTTTAEVANEFGARLPEWIVIKAAKKYSLSANSGVAG